MLKFNKFIIFGHARSGTSIMKLLFESQGVKILGEPFNKDVQNNFVDYFACNGFDLTIKKLMNNYDACKHLMHQQNQENNIKLISKYKTVFIYRKNILDAAISSQIAQKTNVWAASDVSFKSDYHTIDFLDFNLVKQTCEEYSSGISLYQKFLNKSITICYEDFFQDLNKQKFLIKELFSFTNINAKNELIINDLLSEKHKLNKNSWANTLINWNEIKQLSKYNIP